MIEIIGTPTHPMPRDARAAFQRAAERAGIPAPRPAAQQPQQPVARDWYANVRRGIEGLLDRVERLEAAISEIKAERDRAGAQE